MLRISVVGAPGRVGRLLVGMIDEADDLTLAAGLGRGDRGLPACDVVVDFSSPRGLRHWAEVCGRHGVALVSGTTPVGPAEEAALDEASRTAAVLHATNTSLGVAVLNRLAVEAARAMGPGFDVEVVEIHHNRKKDAPSGTAATLAERLREETGRGAIPTHSLRVGDVVGEHQVHVAGDGERLTLTHAATSRETFARGALRAARWISGKPPGRYAIEDVLGLPAVAPPAEAP